MEGVKKILSWLNDQIASEGLAKLLSQETLPATIEEDVLKDVETQIKGLMTVDAAIRNDEVISKIEQDEKVKRRIEDKFYPEVKAKVLHGVEKELKDLAEVKLGVNLNGAETAFEMISAIKDAEIKGQQDEKAQNTIKELKATVEDLSKSVTEKEQELEEKLKQKDAEFHRREVSHAFTSALNKYNWKYDEAVRLPFIEKLQSHVESDLDLKLVNGEIKLYKKDSDHEYMEGNKVVSFKDFIEPKIADHLKKKEEPPAVHPNDLNKDKKDQADSYILEQRRIHGQDMALPKIVHDSAQG